jgi:hypothetical protein
VTDTKKKPGEIASRLLEKMLMPIVATAASAAAGYAAKKLHQLVDESRGAGDVAEQLVERARSVASSNGQEHRSVSTAELTQRREERERGRRERRKSTT